MTDERYTFEQARVRLEEIAAQARKKDTTLEKSLDLLEEGARLALMCTELVDHTDFSDTVVAPADVVPEVSEEASSAAPTQDSSIAETGAADPTGTVGDESAESAAQDVADSDALSDQ